MLELIGGGLLVGCLGTILYIMLAPLPTSHDGPGKGS